MILLTIVLVRGIRESARTNNIMVLLKIGAILVFVTFGRPLHQSQQLPPVRAQRLERRAHRRLHHFLHVYRIRFRIHRR